MRKLILIIIIFLSFGNSYAQFSTMFNRIGYYGSTYSNSIQSCVYLNNHYYLSNLFIDAIGQGLCVVKVNEYGDEIKKIVFQDSNFLFSTLPFNSSITTNDSCIIISANMRYYSNAKKLGYLIKLNQNLDTVWTKKIHHPDTLAANQPGADVYNLLTAIQQTDDSGYIVVGKYNRNCVTNDRRTYLLKVDSLGNTEWRKTYSNIAGVHNIEIIPDGGYVFINNFGSTNIVRTDSLGNELWRKTPNNYMGLGYSENISYSYNNSFIVCKSYLYNNDITPRYGINVIKINIANQQILWDKTFIVGTNFNCITNFNSMGVNVFNDGNILVSGTVLAELDTFWYGSEWGYRGVVLKLNSNGDSLWTKYYGFGPYTNDNQLNDLLLTDDGGFMGVGFNTDSNGVAAWLFKTDANGYVGVNASTSLSVHGINVYPNPASEQITIDFGKLHNRGVIEIYNITGVLVRKEKIIPFENQHELNVSELNCGLYLGKVIFNNGYVRIFRFVVE